VWTGVPLHRLLTACGIDVASAGPFAHVCFDGPDLELHHGTYGTSVPIGRAMDPAQDILIAFQQNGENLKPDHGYPVRIIIPGMVPSFHTSHAIRAVKFARFFKRLARDLINCRPWS
jgi:nitrate reductase (NAD(P)H)